MKREAQKMVKFDGARKIFVLLRTHKAVKYLSEKHSELQIRIKYKEIYFHDLSLLQNIISPFAY